jgi:hypothetical protein
VRCEEATFSANSCAEFSSHSVLTNTSKGYMINIPYGGILKCREMMRILLHQKVLRIGDCEENRIV